MSDQQAPFSWQVPGYGSSRQPALPIVRGNSDFFRPPPTLFTQNTPAHDDQSGSRTSGSDPQSSRGTPNSARDRGERRYAGWPADHPPLRYQGFHGVHPSKVSDHIFIREFHFLDGRDRRWLEVKDVYEGGVFDASRTPWWTHWLIAFAHTKTEMQGSDICKVYKWRYGRVIPGIEKMTSTDETELWLTIADSYHPYAFKFNDSDVSELIDRMWYFLNEARRQL